MFGKSGITRFTLILVIVGIMLLLPFVWHSRFYVYLLTEMMIFAGFALSLDLIVGYTGMVSFGHAGLFATGSYAVAILLTKYNWSLLSSILTAIVIAFLVSVVIGYMSVRGRGIEFAMLTLAFAQLLWTISTKARDLTGGWDGLRINIPKQLDLFFITIDLKSNITYYLAALILLILWYLLLRIVVASPFGHALEAIKENEDRVAHLGVDVANLKLRAFVISGTLAGASGVLYALFKAFVSPELLYWTASGQIVIMALVGGVGTLIGPIVGAAFFVWFQDWVSSYTESWMLIVGLLFVIMVLILPGGVVRWVSRFLRQKEDRPIPQELEVGK